MDHVIGDLQRWLDVFKESEPENVRAHQHIEKAIKELQKYYPLIVGCAPIIPYKMEKVL